jgi:hypothetical protein
MSGAAQLPAISPKCLKEAANVPAGSVLIPSLAAVLVERRHPRQRGDFAPVEAAQLGQVAQQRRAQHPAYSRHAAQYFILVPQRRVAHRAVEVVVGVLELFAQLIDMRAQTMMQRLGRVLEPVLLHHQHPDQLFAPDPQGAQRLALLIGQLAHRRRNPLPVQGA